VIFGHGSYRTLAPEPPVSGWSIGQYGNTGGVTWSGTSPAVQVSSNSAQATTFSAAELLSK